MEAQLSREQISRPVINCANRQHRSHATAGV
jgi:hypothetical protein